MANNKEINLVIKARDEAKKTVTGIAEAMRDLTAAQDGLTKSAAKTDSLLGALGAEFTALNKEIQGLTALGKVSQQLDAAAGSIERLEATVRRSKGSTAELVSGYGKAAAATSQLRREAERAEDALRQQEKAVEATKAEIAALKSGIESASPAYRNLLKEIKASKAPSDELIGRYRAQRDALVGMATAQVKAEASLKGQKISLESLRTASREAATALSVAERHQEGLRSQAVKSTTALKQQRDELGKSKAAMAQAGVAVDQMRKSLDGVELNQGAISAASQKAAADLAKVTAALRKQESAITTGAAQSDAAAQATTAYRNQMQAVRNAQQAWREAQQEANRLAVALRSTTEPTREMQTAFTLARTASRAAKQEYIEQAESLNRLRGATKGTFAGFQQMVTQMQAGTVSATGPVARMAQEQIKLRESTRQTGQAMDRAAVQTRGLGNAFEGLYGKSRQSMSLFQRIRGEVLSLTASYLGLYAAFRTVDSTVKAFQTVEAVQSRLGAVFRQDTAKVSSEVAFLRKEAIRLGISFEVLGDTYSKLTVAADAAGFSQENTRKLFLSVAEAGRVNKTSVDQMRGVFLALEQMISKGKVTSEELRRQLGDRMAGAFSIFAAGLSMTTAELDKAMRAGEVFANQTTMLSFADQLNERFGGQLPNSLESLTAQMGRFGAILFDMKVKVAEAGFAEDLRQAIDQLNKSMQNPAGSRFIQAISDALSGLVRGFVFVVENFDKFLLAIEIFVGFKLAEFIRGIGITVIALGRNFAAAHKQAVALNTGLAGMFNASIARSVSLFGQHLTFLRSGMVGLVASSAAARIGITAFVASCAAARGVLIVLATTFRALWVAIGGFPGLILTGLTVVISTLLANWVSGVDAATESLSRHDELLGKVREGYAKAKEGVRDWAKELQGASVVELQLNSNKLKKDLDKIKDDLKEPFVQIGASTIRTNAAFEEVKKRYREGTISAKEFREEIEAVAKAEPGLKDSIVTELIELANTAVKAEQAIKENSAAIDLMNGENVEAAKATLGLNESLQKVSDTVGGTPFEKYTEGLEKIKSVIPGLTEELERMKAAVDFEQWAQDVMALGPATKETMDLIAQGRAALEAEAIKAAQKTTGSALESSVALLKNFEGFRATPAWDVNAFRVGFGSDTITLSDGTIKKVVDGMAAVSPADALRDLVRRIGDFQSTIKGQVGEERFESFSPQQQAVLTSIAYNYGQLPERIIEAVKSGSATQIADAIRTLAGDNGGINAGRRGTEASLFEGGGSTQAALDLERERAAEAKKFLETLTAQNAERRFEIDLLAKSAREQAVGKAVHDLELQAKKENIALTQEQIDETARLAGAQFDAANKEKLASEEKQRIEQSVNDLLERRKMLMEQIEFQEGQGNESAAEALRQQLEATNTALQAAIVNAHEFWAAVGGEEAINAQLKLQGIKQEVDAVGQSFAWSGKQINDMLAGGISNAFDQFAQAIGEGKNAVDSLKNAFLQFAADFLRQIAQMIIQQAVLNALGGGTTGAGGVGGGISGFLSGLFHKGGIAGKATASRRVSPAWFSNALRYHDGGIAGLKPGEVPAILKKGEEVLTEDDPRHIANGGGGASTPQNIKVVNTIDAGSFISEGLNSVLGEKAILNFIRANSGAVRAAAGV